MRRQISFAASPRSAFSAALFADHPEGHQGQPQFPAARQPRRRSKCLGWMAASRLPTSSTIRIRGWACSSTSVAHGGRRVVYATDVESPDGFDAGISRFIARRRHADPRFPVSGRGLCPIMPESQERLRPQHRFHGGAQRRALRGQAPVPVSFRSRDIPTPMLEAMLAAGPARISRIRIWPRKGKK